MNFGLVILTYNEIEGITALWDQIPKEGFHEIFAVDGGSKDGTIEFFIEKNLQIIGQSKKGRGEAFRIAFNHSDCDVLIFFSPDGNEDTKDIISIKEKFKKNPEADLIIASRMMKKSVNEEDEDFLKWRKWANNGFNFLANLLFNRKLFSNYVTDSINGFRGIKKESFLKMDTNALGYTIEYQTTIRAFKNKMNIIEIPTYEKERIGGESYAKSIPTGLKFIRCLITEIFYK